jgi:hypothetical protein
MSIIFIVGNDPTGEENIHTGWIFKLGLMSASVAL